MFEGSTPEEGDKTPQRDFAKMFDLGRHTKIKDFVDRFESLFKDQLDIREDLKELAGEVLKEEFTRDQLAAMRKIAKLRLDDKRVQAMKALAALEEVGKATGFDLFAWSELDDDAKPDSDD